ncbi:hypothetical protein ACFL60_02915 [Candidatus Omnitrophota bacterium]
MRTIEILIVMVMVTFTTTLAEKGNIKYNFNINELKGAMEKFENKLLIKRNDSNNSQNEEKKGINSILNIVIGKDYYLPKLTSIRNKIKNSGYGKLNDNPGMYYAIHAQDEKGGVMIGYNKYKGSSDNFDISVSNIIGNYSGCIAQPGGRVAFYLGAGANLLYMERKGIPDIIMKDVEYVDWLWGLNGLVGIAVRTIGPIHIGYEIGYTWSKESTLGGTVYDLSDVTQTFTVNFIFFPNNKQKLRKDGNQ